MKRTSLRIAGVLLLLVGAVWFFQGIGVLPGSFMTGQDFWAVAGFLTAIGGVIVFRHGRRRPAGGDEAPSPDPGLETDEAQAKG